MLILNYQRHSSKPVLIQSNISETRYISLGIIARSLGASRDQNGMFEIYSRAIQKTRKQHTQRLLYTQTGRRKLSHKSRQVQD